MNKFPGIALVIDDQFDLAYLPETQDNDLKIQQKSMLGLRNFFEDNFIPFVTISKTDDIGYIKNSINYYNNVRLISLDLDLNNDGDVGETDDFLFINVILKTAIDKYGYFYLIINSAHSEKWEEIKQQLPDEIAFLNKGSSLVGLVDKKVDNIVDKLIELQIKNYSLELIYDFELALNSSRDKAFKGLIDSEKRTWNKIFSQIHSEAGDYASYSINEILLSNLKQHLLNIKYSVPENNDPIDETIIITAFKNSNYINIDELNLGEQKVWTGNLYSLKNTKSPLFNYALIINPECDIAQNKLINYLVVYGYEINENTFPDDYDPKTYDEQNIPFHAFRQGKLKNKLRDKANLSNSKNFQEHFYTLPFASANGKTIVLDFREISTFDFNGSNHEILVKRIIDPMITDILDKISLLFNRKGLPKILTDKIKIF